MSGCGVLILRNQLVYAFKDNEHLFRTILKPARIEVDFLKQFAIGAGVGLRFNLQILLLRLDAAIPIRRPWDYLPQVQQPATKSTNIVFNLAIGYPF